MLNWIDFSHPTTWVIDFNEFNNFVFFVNYYFYFYDKIRYLQNRVPILKKIFIWDHDNPIEKKNHEFYFSTNSILKKNEIKKKQLEKLKDHKLKNKHIKFDG